LQRCGKDTKFWSENLNERDRLDDLDVDESIILKLVLKEIGFENVVWILLALDRDRPVTVSCFIKGEELLN
jgi:hypothetical protein